MQEHDGLEGTAGSDPASKSDASPLDAEALDYLRTVIRKEANDVFHPAFTKRAQSLEKQLEDLSQKISEIAAPKQKQEQVSETEVLSRQIRELSQKYEAAQRQLEDKEVSSHIMKHLQSHNVQMPDVAAVVLKGHFKYDGGRVIAVDEYGQEVETDKVIKDLLASKPGFRPPRNASGTADRGGGGSRPGLPNVGDSNPDELSREDLIKLAGGEEKARKLGYI